MEEARFLSVETRKEAGKVLRVSCSYQQGLCALKAVRRHGVLCLFSMNGYTPMMQSYNSCKLCFERNNDYNWSDVTSVNTTIASPRQPSIWISGKLDCLENFKCSSPTVSDLSDIPMHAFLLPYIISCSLILRRVSCNDHRFSSRFWFSPL